MRLPPVLSRLAAIALWLAVPFLLVGQEPKHEHLYPVSGAQGATVSVAVSGNFAPWPPEFWADGPGLKFKPATAKGKFEIEVAKDAPLGAHLIRMYNKEGASAPLFFVVTKEPDVAEVEPNDEFKAPQKIASLPAVICGRLDKPGDVDSFGVSLKGGETLVAWVEAYVLASTFDSILRIVDSNGVQMAFNHDGRTLDSFLAWKAPRDGVYIVQIMGFRYPATAAAEFTGGDGCVYRLHLTNGPFVSHTLPLAVQRGQKSDVRLLGWNLGSETDTAPVTLTVDATAIPPGQTAIDLPGFASDSKLEVSDLLELMAAEPGASSASPQPITPPCAITGVIDRPHREDRFSFAAVKGRAYAVAVTAGRIGSMLEPWLKVENKEGKRLARGDENGVARDPELVWTAPAAGVYTVALGEVTHRGGPDYLYRLAITEAAPRADAALEKDSVVVGGGKSTELKITFKRLNGFKAALELVAKDLPPGVNSPPVAAPAKDGDVTLKLTADPEAAAANRPFRVILRETESGAEHPVPYRLNSTAINNGVTQGYSTLVINSTDQPWITVTASSPKQ